MKPKKSLGQNFLTSTRAIEKIIEAGDLQNGEKVLEVGPGKGVLTEALLKKNVKVLAVEKDDQLVPFLREKFKKEIESGQFTLIHGDILEFEPKSHALETGKYKLIANIPYYITGALFKMFLGHEVCPSRAVVLVQKEVAERIVAQNTERMSGKQENKESILSISVKAYGNPYYIETVKAGSFVPAPSVDSAILLIEHISKEFFNANQLPEDFFFKVLKTGFSSKRKLLKGNLKKILEQHPEKMSEKGRFENEIDAVFLKNNLPISVRAEKVPLLVWKELAISLYSVLSP